MHIKLPANLQVESLPANQDVKIEYALYRASRKQEQERDRYDTRPGDWGFCFCAYRIQEPEDVSSTRSKKATTNRCF